MRIKQRVKTSGEHLERSLDRLQHVMQQSNLAAKARANREKTVERKEDAAVNWGKEDTQFTNRGQRLLPNAKELPSGSSQQVNHVMSKAGSPSRQPITETNRLGANSPDELPLREMQSVAARAVYKMVPLSTPTAVHDQLACYFVTSTELSTPSWRVQSGHMQVPEDKKTDVCLSAMGKCKARKQSKVCFDPWDCELVCPSGSEGLVVDVVSSLKESIALPVLLRTPLRTLEVTISPRYLLHGKRTSILRRLNLSVELD